MQTWNRMTLEGLAQRSRRTVTAEPWESSQALHPFGSSFPSSPGQQWWAVTFALENFYETTLNLWGRISPLCAFPTTSSFRMGFKFVWTLALQKLLLKAFQTFPGCSGVQARLAIMVEAGGRLHACVCWGCPSSPPSGCWNSFTGLQISPKTQSRSPQNMSETRTLLHRIKTTPGQRVGDAANLSLLTLSLLGCAQQMFMT